MKKLQILLIVLVSAVVGLTTPFHADFQVFYQAGADILQGVNPYANSGYFNPIHVAISFVPISFIPFDIAWRLMAGVMFGLYMLAMLRLFKNDWWWVVILAPFGVLIAHYGNIDALVLLGATLPAPLGVWLLIAKPQIGLFAALIMLWQYRSRKLAIAVLGVLVFSVFEGMIHGGLNVEASIDLWPYGLVVGVPLLWLAWRRKDSVIALGAACFISPYVTALNWCVALPLFRSTRPRIFLGIVLSWAILMVSRI